MSALIVITLMDPGPNAVRERWALPQDIKLIRHSESRAIIEGLPEGRAIALASPDQQNKKAAGGALQALPK